MDAEAWNPAEALTLGQATKRGVARDSMLCQQPQAQDPYRHRRENGRLHLSR